MHEFSKELKCAYCGTAGRFMQKRHDPFVVLFLVMLVPGTLGLSLYPLFKKPYSLRCARCWKINSVRAMRINKREAELHFGGFNFDKHQSPDASALVRL